MSRFIWQSGQAVAMQSTPAARAISRMWSVEVEDDAPDR